MLAPCPSGGLTGAGSCSRRRFASSRATASTGRGSGDIAEEAGVAHGLLYHYFRSKEEVLETIFRSSWEELVRETERIERSELALAEQLRRFASIFLGSWLADPDLVRVLIREIARSPEVGKADRRDRQRLLGAHAHDRARPQRGAR